MAIKFHDIVEKAKTKARLADNVNSLEEKI